MPIEAAAYAATKVFGMEASLLGWRSVVGLVVLAVLYLVRRQLQGRSNPYDAEQVKLHGKVVLLTGGTSGIGYEVAIDLAQRGAQLVLLTSTAATDGWTQQFVQDLRERTANQLIYAEECDLGSLLSIRRFATRWIDSTPARRLDQVVLCHGAGLPAGTERRTTSDGVELHLGIHYLAVRQLLTLLEPAIKAQPADRDVRVVWTTCKVASLGKVDLSDVEWTSRGYPTDAPWRCTAAAKLMTETYLDALADAVQGGGDDAKDKSSSWKRKDGSPSRLKIVTVDPGWLVRTPGLRRRASYGSIFGLILLYVVPYPGWWFLVRSASAGAQSVLYACTAPADDLFTNPSLGSGEQLTRVPGIRNGDRIVDCQPVPRPVVQAVSASDLTKWSEAFLKKTEQRSAAEAKRQR